jgi:hypothetical protein
MANASFSTDIKITLSSTILYQHNEEHTNEDLAVKPFGSLLLILKFEIHHLRVVRHKADLMILSNILLSITFGYYYAYCAHVNPQNRRQENENPPIHYLYHSSFNDPFNWLWTSIFSPVCHRPVVLWTGMEWNHL